MLICSKFVKPFLFKTNGFIVPILIVLSKVFRINADVHISKIWHCNGQFAGQCIVKSNIDTLNLNFITAIKVTAGKTTLISVLVNGDLDDWVGTARMSQFRYLHEIESGETLSISKAKVCFGEDVRFKLIFSNLPGQSYSLKRG